VKLEKAAFAGGCFWCMQHPFDELSGVIQTTVGYTGGYTVNLGYGQVTAGGSGHAEAIEIIFDPGRISYEALLDVYWRQIDPVEEGGQFADRGSHYRTEIFYHSARQKQQAEASRQALAESGRYNTSIVTNITPASAFYPAEQHHQQYYQKNAFHYQCYRSGSGRGQYLREVWSKGAGRG